MQQLGSISFSLYLVHIPVIQAVTVLTDAAALPPFWRAGLLVSLAVVITLVAAAGIWKWVELPCIALGRRVAALGRPAAPPGPVSEAGPPGACRSRPRRRHGPMRVRLRTRTQSAAGRVLPACGTAQAVCRDRAPPVGGPGLCGQPSFIRSAICTAFSAAPFSSWSPQRKKSRPQLAEDGIGRMPPGLDIVLPGRR